MTVRSRLNKLFTNRFLNRNIHRPIIIGPWMGEVGPELQYWIPYLQHLQNKGSFHSRPIYTVSRGGVRSWYRSITEKYIEIFDYVDEKYYEKIKKVAGSNTQKQYIQTKSQVELISKIANSISIKDYDLIHPAEMWSQIIPWLEQKKPADEILSILNFRNMKKLSTGYESQVDKLNLPKEYIVMKFYSSNLLPIGKKEKNFITQIIKSLSYKYYIVPIATSFFFDDHKAFKLPKSNKIIDLPEIKNLRTNLGIQTEIIKRSQAFVGTNGGFTLIALYNNIPVLSFYSQNLSDYRDHYFKHETVLSKLLERIQNPKYLVININAWNGLIHRLFDKKT